MYPIDPSAPAVIQAERVVASPPEEVFRLLVDVQAWPTWQPEVRRVRGESALAPGSTFVWWSGATRITSTITALEADRAVAWTGRALGTRAIHTWSLEPVDGGTLVRTQESMSGWLPRLMPRMVQRTLERGVLRMLDSLESRAR